MAKNNSFEQVIQTYLAKRAAEDELFAVKYKDENKSVAKCCAYIKEEARKKAQNEEVDRILDKLKKSGYENLTSEEKKTLFDASRR